MPHVILTTVYEFDELSDAAKDAARQWYRERDYDTLWAESVIEDAQTIANLMGITFDQRAYKTTVGGSTVTKPMVSWSGFSSQGDGASFDGSYTYKKGSVKAVKAYAPRDMKLHRIVAGLFEVQKKHGYRLRAKSKVRGNYCHSGCMDIEVWDNKDEYIDLEGAVVIELLRDFANWIYRQLEAEYEHETSDEQVDENIRANGYTFTKDGRRKG